MLTIPPTRSNCMDHIFAGQVVSFCDFCAAGLAAMQHTAFCKQFRSGGTMNAAVHTAATQKRSVGSIDDCVNAHFCNIVSDNLQRHEAYPHSSNQCPCLFQYLFKVSHTFLSILPLLLQLVHLCLLSIPMPKKARLQYFVWTIFVDCISTSLQTLASANPAIYWS